MLGDLPGFSWQALMGNCPTHRRIGLFVVAIAERAPWTVDGGRWAVGGRVKLSRNSLRGPAAGG